MKILVPSAALLTTILISAATAQDLTVSGSQAIFANDRGPFEGFGNVLALSTGLGLLAVGVSGSDGTEASDTGAVYLYSRANGSANGWGFVQKLTASDAERADNFGSVVAASSEMIAIGQRASTETIAAAGSISSKSAVERCPCGNWSKP